MGLSQPFQHTGLYRAEIETAVHLFQLMIRFLAENPGPRAMSAAAP